MSLKQVMLALVAVVAAVVVVVLVRRAGTDGPEGARDLKCDWVTGSPETKSVTLKPDGPAEPLQVGQHHILFPPNPVTTEVTVTVAEFNSAEVGFEITTSTGQAVTFRESARILMSFAPPRCPPDASGATITRDGTPLPTVPQGPKVLRAFTPGTSRYMIAE